MYVALERLLCSVDTSGGGRAMNSPRRSDRVDAQPFHVAVSQHVSIGRGELRNRRLERERHVTTVVPFQDLDLGIIHHVLERRFEGLPRDRLSPRTLAHVIHHESCENDAKPGAQGRAAGVLRNPRSTIPRCKENVVQHLPKIVLIDPSAFRAGSRSGEIRPKGLLEETNRGRVARCAQRRQDHISGMGSLKTCRQMRVDRATQPQTGDMRADLLEGGVENRRIDLGREQLLVNASRHSARYAEGARQLPLLDRGSAGISSH